MFIRNIFVYLSVLKLAIYAEIIGCLHGEKWFEKCKKCKCIEDGKYVCVPHFQSCSLGKCIQNVVVFNENLRCHCTKNNTMVCVELSYQKDLDDKPCVEDSYYYDNCTYCRCDQGKTVCNKIQGCSLSSGGICQADEEFIEDCFKCSCTLSKFRKCLPLEKCLLGKKKQGKCYYYQRFFPMYLQKMCISARIQECYSDYDCPREKKCCQVVDCFLRCVEPKYT